MRRQQIKNHLRESRSFTQRAIFAGVVFAVMIGAVGAHLAKLQIQDHQHFVTRSDDNQVKIQALAPVRGLIYDRNGVLLAENLASYDLEIIPELVNDPMMLYADLGAILDIGPSDIRRYERLKDSPNTRPYSPVPLRTRLTEDEVAAFSARRHQFIDQGVDIHARLTRHYPHGALTAHAVGYVGRINERELKRIDETNYRATTHIGKTGAEHAFEDQLHGQAGLQKVEANHVGRILRVLDSEAPTAGEDVHLSIDIRLHKAAEEALQGRKGALVAIKPDTGEILALVSMPTFKPNLFVNGIDQKSYDALNKSNAKPLFNRALRGRYPPGSTIKPIVALAGLHHQHIHTDKEIFCPGFYQLPNNDHKYRDWKKWGHGKTDMNWAIMQSCDVYFYDLARNLGIDPMHDFLARFGFGRPTGLELSGESAGLLPSSQWKRRALKGEPWYPGETLIAGIGQGFFLATPLQLASSTATLAMRGLAHRPTLLRRSNDAITGVQDVGLDVQPSHWGPIIEAMVDVVNKPSGTARKIHNPHFLIAGKTGTAQVFTVKQDEEYDKDNVAELLRDHALFVAFAPVEDPQIAVAVIVENGGSGGSVAAPVAATVIDAYLHTEIGPPRPMGFDG